MVSYWNIIKYTRNEDIYKDITLSISKCSLLWNTVIYIYKLIYWCCYMYYLIYIYFLPDLIHHSHTPCSSFISSEVDMIQKALSGTASISIVCCVNYSKIVQGNFSIILNDVSNVHDVMRMWQWMLKGLKTFSDDYIPHVDAHSIIVIWNIMTS